jgi:hypothetical protein
MLAHLAFHASFNLSRLKIFHGKCFCFFKYERVAEYSIKGSPIQEASRLILLGMAFVLCAGDKTGLNEKKFYKEMIRLADAEYRNHLTRKLKLWLLAYKNDIKPKPRQKMMARSRF